MNKNLRIYKNTISNENGKMFEQAIVDACKYYENQSKCYIVKIPEPFKVLKKHDMGLFEGRFVSKAEPDFMGTLNNGTAIVMESKYTSKDRINQTVLTDKQIETLSKFHELRALAFVIVGIQDKAFVVPITVWKNMKEIFNRKYVTKEDLKEYEVKYDIYVRFLDNIKI